MVNRYLTRDLHGSWHIALASVGVVCGVVAAQAVALELFISIAWVLTGVGLLLTGIWRKKAGYICFSIVGGLLIGLWRGSFVLDDLSVFKSLLGQTVTIRGTVAEDIETNKRGQMVLRLTALVVDGRELRGSVWTTTEDSVEPRRSDMVTAKVKISEGFGSFAATAYNAAIIKVERPVPGDVALEVRDTFADGVQHTVAEPQASLGLGYLVGQRRGLPEELDAALKAAGLTHIVVASGYNLTILVRLARRVFEKVSKYLAFISAGGMILGFIAVTGMSPSMSRAGLVAGLSLLAWYYGRKFHPLVLLPFAMAITVLVQPSYAWGDIGWQLSFAAFAGVMILAPLLQAYLFGDKPERPLRRILIETISAQLFTLPILLVAFGEFSLVAPIANLLILPLVPLAMLLTFIAGTGGLVLGGAAEMVGLPAELLLTYMTMTAEYTGGLPWAVQPVSITMPIAIGVYLIIILGCVYMSHRTKVSLAATSLVE